MKNLIIVGIMAALTGCATQYQSAGQNYRLKGADNTINIEGKLNQSVFGTENSVEISFNGTKQITVPVDYKYFGEANGEPYNGKQTSASCTGNRKSSHNVEVRCMVFVDNERTVTLTF